MRGIERRIWVYGGLCALAAVGIVIWAVSTRLPQREEPKAITPAPAEPKQVLESSLAGTWYDADPTRLSSEIQGYLAKAPEKSLANVQALVLPHAGYRYSGQTAAYGIKQVTGTAFSRVIVMGPSHRVSLENMASVPDATHYVTPLGEVPLDRAFVRTLKAYPQFHTVPQVHDQEHSVQIEIPLLQAALGQFMLVPMVVGDLDLDTARAMGEILTSLMDDRTLVVASTDFTHYGSNYRYVPFKDDIAKNLETLDMGAYEYIAKKDLEGFYAYIHETGATICGRCAVGVLLAMLPDDAEAHLLRYDTSGAMTGDYSNSVSYCTIAFTGKWRKGTRMEPSADAAALAEDDKKRLLELARKTIEYVMEKQAFPEAADLGVEVTPPMKAIRGAFVTLEKEGMLRGCIGDIFPSRPLYKAVIANAFNAAFRDTRFRPVTKDEIPELHVEISVLSPPAPVDSYERIIVGRHGVLLSKEGRRAVYLPQVAPEQGWDRDTMLVHLSQKAGLPQDAWKEGASFEVFEAAVFEEEEA